MTPRGEKYIRALSALAVAVCILFGAVFAERVAADEGKFPTLYCNDEVWYKEDILPLERYYQSYYMPVSVLEYFEGISITENKRFGTLLITYSGDETSFISFNTNKNSAMTDELGEFYVLTYTNDTERYVPVETVCSSLGLTAEFHLNSDSDKMALRLCDGKQKRSFEELIALYAYEDDPGTETTEPPVVDPPEPIGAKTVYLTFDNIDNGLLDTVLSELEAHKKKATFFVSPSIVSNDPSYLIKIVASGHSVGLSFDSNGYEASPVTSFEDQNKTLVRVLKYGVRFARIYGTVGDEAYTNAYDKATEAEYAIWEWNVDLTALDARDIVVNIALLDSYTKENDVMTLRFYGNEYCADMLAQTLDYLDDKVKCTAKAINDATNNKH